MLSLISYGRSPHAFEHLYAEQSFSFYHTNKWELVIRYCKRTKVDGILFNDHTTIVQPMISQLKQMNFTGLIVQNHKNTVTLCYYNQKKTIIHKESKTFRLANQIFVFLLNYQTPNLPSECSFSKIPFIGSSESILDIKSKICSYAKSKEPVLILGETGTGKNIVAKCLHEFSDNTGDFMNINCSAINENLFESELFGFKRGSFTGAFKDRAGLLEHAKDGTLFLDEVGEIPMTSQSKLLKVIEEKEYYQIGSYQQKKTNARIISATNKNIFSEVGTFRKDLLYRINTLVICIPPLREHVEDIPELVYSYLSSNYPEFTITEESLEIMKAQSWPGNVRELFSFLARCAIFFQKSKNISVNSQIFDTLYMQYNTFHTM